MSPSHLASQRWLAYWLALIGRRVPLTEKMIVDGRPFTRRRVADIPKLSKSCSKEFGCTPLHRAASTGHYGLCELLIEKGAEIDAVDRAGETPLMSAVICDNKKVALLLIRHGANVDIQDNEGYTVLDRASDDFSSDLIDAAKGMPEV